MSDDQSTAGTNSTSPRLWIGIAIVVLLAVAIVALLITRQSTRASGLLPALATPTVLGDVSSTTAVTVTFSELNADPLAYLDKPIQVNGEYLPLEKPSCSRYSGPELQWALVAEGLQLEIKGYERIVRILNPGTQMTVQGIWRLYQGPLGCGKGPSTGSAWYLQTQKIVLLFNPREDVWQDHFVLQGGEIVGLTPTGRATVRLLNMNAPHRVELREEWLAE